MRRKLVMTALFAVAVLLLVGRGVLEVKRLLDDEGGDAAQALSKALPWAVFLGAVILLGLVLTYGIAWRDERVRKTLGSLPGVSGAVLVETDRSTSQGLRSAYPNRFQATSNEIVPSRSVLTWSSEGISLWHTIYRDKPVVELPWAAVSLGVSRLLVGRSVRPALDVQLEGGPIHLQFAVRRINGVAMRFDRIEQVQAMIDRMVAGTQNIGGPEANFPTAAN